MHYSFFSRKKISKLGLGTHQFGGGWGIKFSQKDFNRYMDISIDYGINHIDTSDLYNKGQVEKMIGNYVVKHKKKSKDLIICTKFGQMNDYSEKNIVQILDASLKKLKIEQIGIYYFHSGNNRQFNNEVLWNKLNKEKEKGKIKKLGLSLKNSLLLKNDFYQINNLTKYNIESVQLVYNPIFPNAKKIFPLLKKNKINIISRVPLAKGLLTGKHQDTNNMNKIDKDIKLVNKIIFKKTNKIYNNLKRKKIIPSIWALNQSLNNKYIDSTVVGVKNLDQLFLNLSCM